MKVLSEISSLLLIPLVSACNSGTQAGRPAENPNVVFILIDDMGWKDLESYGAELYETPHIDSLCYSGTRFGNAYTSVSICAPARASALTGYHPAKLGMWNHFHHLPDNPVTLANVLNENGYATWHVGKWHCGSPENNTMPENLGFEVNIGGGESWGPGSYFWPFEGRKVHKRNYVPNVKEVSSQGDYLTDVLTDQAISLIKKRDKNKPFYLNLWHYAVHVPHQAKQELVSKYRQKIIDLGLEDSKGRLDPATGNYLVTSYTDSIVAVYAAMIESVDQSVGKIVQTIRKEGLYENTLFVFYSDNGPVTDRVPCAPFLGGKNSTYEAGVRVPAFFTWEGHIPAGEILNSRINITDIPLTILDMTVGKDFPKSEEQRDGISIAPLFKGKPIEDREFIWYFPDSRLHWAQRANAAIMSEDGYKYLMFFNGDEDELYNINTDFTESVDIIQNHSEKAEKLQESLVTFLAEYYHRMPPPPDDFKEMTERRLGI